MRPQRALRGEPGVLCWVDSGSQEAGGPLGALRVGKTPAAGVNEGFQGLHRSRAAPFLLSWSRDSAILSFFLGAGGRGERV